MNYYYIPDGEDQEWLLNRVQTLDLTGKSYERRWEGKKETGWTITEEETLKLFEEWFSKAEYVWGWSE